MLLTGENAPTNMSESNKFVIDNSLSARDIYGNVGMWRKWTIIRDAFCWVRSLIETVRFIIGLQ